MDTEKKLASESAKNAWTWIPTLYFAEGVPNAMITSVSLIMLKSLADGMNNTQIVFWTSFLGLPWVLKPLWAPVIDLYGKKRSWIIASQFLLAVCFIIAAILLPIPGTNMIFIGILMLAGFVSATHDAAADGFYIIALNEHSQSVYSGIRNSFYRAAMLSAQGGLVILAGYLIARQHLSPQISWLAAFALAGAVFLILALYHSFIIPKVQNDTRITESGLKEAYENFVNAFVSFFKRQDVMRAVIFLLFYRFAESQLGGIAKAFLLESTAKGGIGLTVEKHGLLYGTIGLIAMMAGGIIGGLLIARNGFGKWVWPMAMMLNLPNLLYVYLAFAVPSSLWIVGSCVALEQLGYGISYAAYAMFMVFYAGGSGKYKTSHFALMTGFAALSIMLPGMISGYLQENSANILNAITSFFGSASASTMTTYQIFFLWIMICTIPSFIVVYIIRPAIRDDFGKKQ